jgi:hypothetical protein
MKHSKTLLAGTAVMLGAFILPGDATAWVAAAATGRGGVAVAGGGYHGAAYHPAGCYGCGGGGAAVAGMVVGAAIATSAKPPPPPSTTVVVVQAAAPAPHPGTIPFGTEVAVVPAGSNSVVIKGSNYYQSGATWYKPYYGSSGVYYEVVPAP